MIDRFSSGPAEKREVILMRTLIKNALIIDGVGNQFPNGAIAISGKAIEGLFTDGTAPAGKFDTVIDATGKVAIPGIINCHVHLAMNAGAHPMNALAASTPLHLLMQGIESAQKMIKKGITTVRDCGAKEFEILLLRDYIKKGVLSGPRVLAGQAIKITGGHYTGRVVDGPVEAKRAAREQISAGVDFIKLMGSGGLGRPNEIPGAPELDEDEMRAAIDEGKKHNLKSAAHAHGRQSMLNALAAGVDTLEHATFMDDEIIEIILKKKIIVVPTFQPYYQISTMGVEAGLASYMVESAREVYAEKLPRFQKALKAGIKIAFGTDAGAPYTPHEDVVTETRIMVEMGMKPMDVITSCTANAAEALDLADSLGSIAKGKIADIVLLNANPLQDISKLGDVYKVIKEGQLID